MLRHHLAPQGKRPDREGGRVRQQRRRRANPLTDRRAPAGTPLADRCPLTGHRRLSYRRAAELFAEASRPFDPAGRGLTLHRLSVLPWAGPGGNA
ncbi:hypothetical protein [Streptacidiphilus neutrinimicus]|uniref:hypothetical protein n=1 Tax=Streptacidiphilus neutrinimicus TaxID=105420 RepID=UPI0005A869CD|nr:hypothetical protein [Streptacidiphilus neutrinimicus]